MLILSQQDEMNGVTDTEQRQEFDPLSAELNLAALGGEGNGRNVIPSSSFAAMERLVSSVKASKLEIESLKKQLLSTEESRDNLARELAEIREANEKLPYLESTVAKLTREVSEKDAELQSTLDDMREVKELYRAQLDELVEFRATNTPLQNRKGKKEVGNDEEAQSPLQNEDDRHQLASNRSKNKITMTPVALDLNRNVRTPNKNKQQNVTPKAKAELTSPYHAATFDLVF
mmetsp:Transcript_30612/g.70069  ORF Transcript_30612/g.70069 Transcript_30612/m.70069 type:complete len:232 (+) Transcript_30612:2379-3074(+)